MWITQCRAVAKVLLRENFESDKEFGIIFVLVDESPVHTDISICSIFSNCKSGCNPPYSSAIEFL